MQLTRRSLIAAFAGVLAVPVPALAEDDERAQLIAHVRACIGGFDVAEVFRRASADLRLPRKWVGKVLALLDGRDTTHGFRTLAELDLDPAFSAASEALLDEAKGALSMKLALLRATRRIPETADGRSAALEAMFADWFGLDLPRVRAHVAAYDPGLLVVVGPARELPELVASWAREPFVRYLELVHGRRATEWVAGRDSDADLYTKLLDPAFPVVAFAGHGSWGSFSAYGFFADPPELIGRIADQLRTDPRHALPALFAPDYRYLGFWPTRKPPLTEADLAALVDQWGGVAPKELVVRYTCGVGRYRVDAPPGERLVWKLLPDEVADQVRIEADGAISAKRPDFAGTWEAPLAAWLAEHRVPLLQETALGTCLVADPMQTRGYAGLSWTQHFIEDPIPAWSPPYAWPKIEAETASAPGPDAGAPADAGSPEAAASAR